MRISLFILVLIWAQLGISQSSNLDAYEYVIVPMQFEFQSKPNQYQLNILARVLLKEKGFKVFMDEEEKPLEVRTNVCNNLKFRVVDEDGFLTTKLRIHFYDCYDALIFESEEGVSRIKEFDKSYKDALRNVFDNFPDHVYDESKKSSSVQSDISGKNKVNKATTDKIYANKRAYKLNAETFWLKENENKGYVLLANDGLEHFAELKAGGRGTYVFNSENILGVAYFDSEGNLIVEYQDEDLNEIQTIIFRKVD